MQNQSTFTATEIDRIIEMAWEDKTPFEAIAFQFGIAEKCVTDATTTPRCKRGAACVYSASNRSITCPTRSLISCHVGFNSLVEKVPFSMSIRSKTIR